MIDLKDIFHVKNLKAHGCPKDISTANSIGPIWDLDRNANLNLWEWDPAIPWTSPQREGDTCFSLRTTTFQKPSTFYSIGCTWIHFNEGQEVFTFLVHHAEKRKKKRSNVRRVFCFYPDFKNYLFLFLQPSSWYISTLFGIYHLTSYTSFYTFLYRQAWFLSRPLPARGWKEWCIRANKFYFTIVTEAFNPPIEIVIVNCGDLWFSLWIILHGFRTTIWDESMVQLVLPQLTTFPKLDWSFQKRSLHTTAFSTFTVN